MSILVCCILTLLSIFSNSLPVKRNAKVVQPVYRLPQNIWPEEYNLVLTFAKDTFQTLKFSGELQVTFKPTANVTEIKLHSNKLQFADIKLFQDATEIPLKNSKFEIDPVADIVTLNPDRLLVKNTMYKLQFQYTGELRTKDLCGFYRSQYKENGQIKYLATTQFQAVSARRAFPCFDEPIFKATFLISIKHPSTLTALSNTPVISKNTVEGVTTTSFEKTPKMSTYLVAFVLSEFTCEKSVSNIENIPHRICSRKQTALDRKLALDVGPKLLKALEDFTGIKYSCGGIKKIDQVAIPDFQAGAMENWGLATYREVVLLWDKEESSNRYEQSVTMMIAHELAHMWFGNLVTLHWWSDTFLNEGLATYCEHFITAEIEPSWELDKQFVIGSVHKMLELDSLHTSKPLSSEVNTPSEISERFGPISYDKGASVIRMVEHFMGKSKFKWGIQQYFNRHAFGNTVPSDLWKSLKVQGSDFELPADFETVIEEWIKKSGYPVLQVVDSGADVIISQKRFLTDGTTPQSSEQWYVPITYTLSVDSNKFQNTLPKKWLLPNKNLTISDVLMSGDDQEWVILNNQQTGFYRVSYNDVLLDRIIKALNKPNFDRIIDIQRAYLIDDFYNFAKAGSRTYLEFLNFISFIQKDTSYYPWHSTVNAFSGMMKRTGDVNLREQLSKYLSKLIESLYSQLAFDSIKYDHQIYTLKKVLALSWACTVGIHDCLDDAKKSFKKYKLNGQKINKNLKSIVYCNGLRHSTAIDSDWNFLWKEYQKSELASEQGTILKALGCAKDKYILINYLEISINASGIIRKQDALTVFKAVYNGNPEGVDIAAQFFYDNYKAVSDFYASTSGINSVVSGLTDLFTRQSQVDKLQEFVNGVGARSTDEAMKSAVTEALANSVANLKITNRLENELNKFFKSAKFSSMLRSESTTMNFSAISSSSSLNVLNMVTFVTILFTSLRACELVSFK